MAADFLERRFELKFDYSCGKREGIELLVRLQT